MEKEKRRPPTTELEALEKIGKKGGRIDYRALAGELGLGSHYMSVICRALGNADYIDFLGSGICALTPEGREQLRKKGLLKEEEIKEMEIKQAEKFGFVQNPKIERKSKGSSTPKTRIKSAEELFVKKTGMEEGVKGFPTQKPQIPREAVPLNDVELEILKALGQCGGRMAGRTLAARIGHSYDYTDRYYRTLGHVDLIDYMGSGVCVLTPKGRELLRKMGLLV